MTNKQSGYIVLVAAIGMMCGLLALDIQKLETWSAVGSPQFVAQLMGHFASVVTAFIGGKLIPTEPQNQREGDE